jgi:outer membrane protein TolC
MNYRSLFTFITLLTSLNVYAFKGIEQLEKELMEKNQDVLALQKQNESKEALHRAAFSGFYPTLNAVTGFANNRTNDKPNETGYVGYFEGNLNLYRGFKDQAIISQREIDQRISHLELEVKKRDLRLNLTELVSEVISLHKLQHILEEEYKVTQIQKQMAAKKVAAGLTGLVDNFEIDLRENEIKIEQAQIDQKHLEVHQKFIRLFGEDISDTELGNLDFSGIDVLTQYPSSDISLEKTLDFQQAFALEEKAAIEKKELKSDFLPSVDLFYNFGRLTPSENSPMNFNEYKYGLMVTIPLFSGLDTHYKTKSATLLIQAAEKLKFQKRNDVQSDIGISKTKLTELKWLFDLNEQKLISAQKYFDLTLSEYKRGIKNSPDLVGSTERLFSSKKKKVEILKELELINAKFQNYASFKF